MNKKSAIQWLEKAWHNLSSANVLYGVDHYSDVIAVEAHYSLEKILKSFFAYNNEKIPKTHNLEELYFRLDKQLELSEVDIDILSVASEYHIEESYPSIHRQLPDKKELNDILIFTEKLLQETCLILEIEIDSIKKT